MAELVVSIWKLECFSYTL